MFEGGLVGDGGEDEPVEEPITEVHSVELVAELVEVFLEELRPHAVVHVPHQGFGVGNGDVYPREHLGGLLRGHAFSAPTGTPARTSSPS